MTLVSIASSYTFDVAARAARQVEVSPADGLATPVLGALMGQFEEVWDKIEAALRTGYRFGRSRAEDGLQNAIQAAEELLSKAGNKAEDIGAMLVARTQRFSQEFIRCAFAEVPIEMDIGGKKYRLSGVSWTQTVVLTGSIKASLTELLSFVAEGQLQIAGDYAPL